MIYSKTVCEFFRYLFVGGFAFICDFVTLILCREFVFNHVSWGVYLSVFLGFSAGHVTNYVMSLLFVFRDAEARRNGWTWKAFWLFTIVGASGAGLTELGMFIGHGLMHFNYILVKIVVACGVLLWNFIGRKLIVTRKKEN